MATKTTALRVTDEQTGIQTVGGTLGETLANPLPKSYKTYRELRKDPTVALARAFVIAPVVAGEWSVEAVIGAPPERVEFVRRQFQPIREPLLQRAMEGGVDFGWMPFEKVFEADKSGDMVRLRRLKPLLHDITGILIDGESGAFEGFRQVNKRTGQDVDVGVDHSLLINFRVEGDNHYGESLLENVRETVSAWNEAQKAAKRYDRKIAGSHFVIYFPKGTSRHGVGGAIKDNGDIAASLLESLEAAGSISIPQEVVRSMEDLNAQSPTAQWRVELLSGGPQQYAFDERLRYMDTLKARGLLTPERAILEGQFGTKAEAGAHQDLALTLRELDHRHITRLVNWHGVDQLLAQNWGEEARGTVYLKAAPLADEKKAWLREVYKLLLANPSGFLEELEFIDRKALKEAVAVPLKRNAIDPESLTRIPTSEPAAQQDQGVKQLAATVADLFNEAVAGVDGN